MALRGGTTSKDSRRDIYYPRSANFGLLRNGAAAIYTYKSEDILLENFLTFRKSFGINTIVAAGRYSWQTTTSNIVNNDAENFPDYILGTDAFQTALKVYNPFTYKEKRVLNSYFLRAGYNFKEKCYLSFSGRVDGSSVFSTNYKYAFFLSVGASWRIIEEDFMKTSSFSDLKLRASYGLTGNQAINPYGSLSRLGSFNYLSGNTQVSGTAPTTLGNSDLKWERTLQNNIGVDFALFADKLYGTVDYYSKTTKDLLQAFVIPPSSGFTSITKNIRSI